MNDAAAPPPAHETREEFLTARQLAAILQVSETTVRRLARKGRIPSIRLTPRITRFHLQAVRQALDGKPRSRRSTAEAEEAENPQLSFTDLLKNSSQ
jgi:excisionase family DNA binding protein